MATAEPILDLSTLIERPTIRVDGASYHLKSPDELTLLDSQRFTAWGKELEALGREPDKVEQLEKLVGEVASAALADMPDEVFSRIPVIQRMAIVEVFTGLLLGRRMAMAGAVVKNLGRSTGASSSRASSTPMAATPDGGSSAPPPLSSGPT